jgi:hypothetical protein
VTEEARLEGNEAGVEQETTSPAEAYAELEKWKPGRPKSWDGLPWG